jgi:drug/metabolite transporter (DMT)-like permease
LRRLFFEESDGMIAKMANAWWLILISVTTGVAGQTVMKIGVSAPGATEATSNITSLVLLILRSPLVLLGLFLYGVGALAWIAVLSRLELSLAYPFLALNFVLITLSSRFLLGESVPSLRWLGILVIISGILLVARSN